MKGIVILGSTGSIGTSTLKVVRASGAAFRVEGLAAGRNVGLLEEQIRGFNPRAVSVEGEDAAGRLRERWGKKLRVLRGEEGLMELARLPEAELLVSAIPGLRGLLSTLAALEEGKTVALAAKEILVAAGGLVMEAARRAGREILPVDSEHSAIFQCLRGEKMSRVRRIILTASGGPFLEYSRAELDGITPEQALKHPRWEMGRKVTLDSATLMNKGLEVLEAAHLFSQPLDRIEVVIHPQSIVHSLVEMRDGSVLAQLGLPDMCLPIQYALNYPDRADLSFGELDFYRLGELTFREPDRDRFPALDLAYRAGAAGGTMPAVLSAANEVAGEAFLQGKISFPEITKITAGVMKEHRPASAEDIGEIIRADAWARRRAAALLGSDLRNTL